ncbi:MAG: hypothetical protein WC496_10330 [Phycisphaerae bacterium]|jgi:hypothetical protein
MVKQVIIWTLFTVICLFCGCTEKQTIAPEPKCLSGINTDSAMKAAERVLIGMNFVIDKADANLAVMTTKPLTGGQFFELWRRDNVGGYNNAVSNLHSIQRTVELDFNGKQAQVCIGCTVKVERLSIPEKEIDSTARAYSMFSRSSGTRQSLSLNAKQEKNMDWVDIGRDNRLEAVILNKIDKEISKAATKGKK